MYTSSITFMDNSSIVVSSCKMTLLPLKEEIIISKSIEFFCDPEPCFIHRGAVMTRIIAEIDDYLFNASKRDISEILWSDFPEKYRSTLDIPGDVHIIKFEICEKTVDKKSGKHYEKVGYSCLKKANLKE